MIKSSYKNFEIATLAKQMARQTEHALRLNKLLEILIKREEPVTKLKNLFNLIIELKNQCKLPKVLQTNLQRQYKKLRKDFLTNVKKAKLYKSYNDAQLRKGKISELNDTMYEQILERTVEQVHKKWKKTDKKELIQYYAVSAFLLSHCFKKQRVESDRRRNQLKEQFQQVILKNFDENLFFLETSAMN